MLLLLLTVSGLLLSRGASSDHRPAVRWDDPVPGFKSVPGILEPGAGPPRDGLRLVVTGVARGDGEGGPFSMKSTEACVNLRLEEADGKPISAERWRILDPDSVALEGAPGIYGSVYSGTAMWFGHVNETGEFFVSLCALPVGEVRVRRMVLDVPVIPVQAEGRLRWTVRRGQDLGVTFLDRILFVEFDQGSVSWGAHSRGRSNPPTTIGTCLQGVLEEYRVLDALGREPPLMLSEGRSWGMTHYGSIREAEEPTFPLKVEARWRRCGPTATCRFVIEDVRIPAPPGKAK